MFQLLQLFIFLCCILFPTELGCNNQQHASLYPGLHWVASAHRVAHRGTLRVLIVYSMSIDCNTSPSVCQVEHNSLCSSPPRTQKVSWTPAQTNVTRVPAGVVSGSTGRRKQARLCPTRAACGSVSKESRNHVGGWGVYRAGQLSECDARDGQAEPPLAPIVSVRVPVRTHQRVWLHTLIFISYILL